MRYLGAVLLAAGVAAFAPGASAQQSSISLDQPTPVFGDVVTFTWSGSWGPEDRNPWIEVRCYQPDLPSNLKRNWNEGLVSDEYHAAFAASGDTPAFTLGPTVRWTGGAARCVGRLLEYRRGGFHESSRTVFDVGP